MKMVSVLYSFASWIATIQPCGSYQLCASKKAKAVSDEEAIKAPADKMEEPGAESIEPLLKH